MRTGRVSARQKIKPASNLAAILKGLQCRGKRVVFTNGCFDLLHAGHAKYLERAAALGDVLVVGMNSDSSVRAIKGRSRPLNRERDRAMVLAALTSVDYVTIFDEKSPELVIRRLKPDVLVKGGDWKIDDIVGADFVKSYGGRVVRVPLLKGRSTTLLINKILQYVR